MSTGPIISLSFLLGSLSYANATSLKEKYEELKRNPPRTTLKTQLELILKQELKKQLVSMGINDSIVNTQEEEIKFNPNLDWPNSLEDLLRDVEFNKVLDQITDETETFRPLTDKIIIDNNFQTIRNTDLKSLLVEYVAVKDVFVETNDKRICKVSAGINVWIAPDNSKGIIDQVSLIANKSRGKINCLK